MVWPVLKRLALGLVLIFATSALLLASDWQQRHARRAAASAAGSGGASGASTLGKTWRISLVEFNAVADSEEAEAGLMDGLKRSGLVEGRDYTVKIRNAQGDMATLPSLMDASVTDGADMIMTLSTPTLQAALQRAGTIPIIFTYCASPIAAGAGKTQEDHLPNVTGVSTAGASAELVDVLLQCMPNVKKVGTLFVPAEVNTVFLKDKLKEQLVKRNVELVEVPASTASEVADAAISMCNSSLDAICQVPGNLTTSSFVSIAKAAKDAGLPVFAMMVSTIKQGASVVVSRDYHIAGMEAAKVAARVMRGEDPARIPFAEVGEVRVYVNQDAADAVHLKVPESVLKRAQKRG